MAFRSAVRGRHGAAGVIGIGGDVPPELLADAGATFPYVLLARGARDEWLTAQKFRADLNALRPGRRRRGFARSNTTAAMNGARP